MIQEIYTALNLLTNKGYEAFLVGGAVRNYLLNKPIDDYDIATNADPNVIKMVFSDYTTYDIGKALGTVVVLINKVKIDITPYRIESDYKDFRHPNKVEFSTNLKDDLKRRDFTINALCLDSNNNIVDLFGGVLDLNNKVIRCINNPDTRFYEDPLRILRAIRFKSKLDFTIEEETNRSLLQNKDLLNHISPERKKEELLKILCNKNAFSIINEYIEVFNTFMPFTPTLINNNFSNPLYSLAYLLIDKQINLKSLKYSKEEINLINTLISSSKIDLSNDYYFIKCLSDINQKHILTYLSELNDTDYTDRFNALHKYMVITNDLKIDGNIIKSFNYHDEQIKVLKLEMVDLIHQQKLENNEVDLLNYIKNK